MRKTQLRDCGFSNPLLVHSTCDESLDADRVRLQGGGDAAGLFPEEDLLRRGVLAAQQPDDEEEFSAHTPTRVL